MVNDAHFLDLFNIHVCGTVENWELRTIDLYETVVYSESVERRHAMLDGGNSRLAFLKHRATIGGDNILGYGLDGGLTFKVYSLYLVSCILWRWVKSNGKAQSCVQAFTEKGETPAQRFLFFSVHKSYFFEFFNSATSFCSSLSCL